MNVAPGAWRYALLLAVLAVPTAIVSFWGAGVFLLLAVGVLGFFRDPNRHPPPAGIIAPADGRVSILREEEERVRVGIYMNVLDVHVNRAPIAGEVTAVDHRTGAHRPAFSKESDRNERVHVGLAGAESLTVDLIAGAFARRVTPYVSEGDEVDRGQRIGHIAFGSRADVLLPPDYEWTDLRVGRGDRVRAGESVLAIREDVISSGDV